MPGDSLRVWSFDRFPFLVFYRVNGDMLDVLRVLHERRDIVASLIAH
ncbi:type II toxin-antitoxin system RelE/ParE family toxin [Cupriavidus basilensis]